MLPACGGITQATKAHRGAAGLSTADMPTLYREALRSLDDASVAPDYARALEKFRAFKKRYPKDPRAKEAGYWIKVLEKVQTLKNIDLENISQ
jgi:TolA-binding protein